MGEEHAVIAELYMHLARDLDRMAQNDEAGQMYRAALRGMTRMRGANHLWTSVAGNNLAGHLEKLAYYSDAEKLYRRAVEIIQAAEGETDGLLATAYNNFALNLNWQAKK
jgi:hypothetical protein